VRVEKDHHHREDEGYPDFLIHAGPCLLFFCAMPGCVPVKRLGHRVNAALVVWMALQKPPQGKITAAQGSVCLNRGAGVI